MKILGLDLGVSSVGWALIECDETRIPKDILGVGCRIIPMTEADEKDFNKGVSVTPCRARTIKRSARRRNFRFKMRRRLLCSYLDSLGMLPDSKEMTTLSPLELWGMRAKAATPNEQLSLKDLGRVLLHMNQKRGYRHSRLDNSNKEETQHVQNINNRYAEIQIKNQTVGQAFFDLLKESVQKTETGQEIVNARLKERVFPREAYMKEFDKIMEVQSVFYPQVLTYEVIENLHYAIFHQRPLKSCKHLVSYCEFASKEYTTKDGRKVIGGPKVAPRTSPLAQICRLYEAVNNIRLFNINNKGRKGVANQPSLFSEDNMPKDLRLLQEVYILSPEEKERVVEFLSHNEKLTATNLLKLLGLKKADGFVPDQAVKNGIKGDETLLKLREALRGYDKADELLTFNLKVVDSGRISNSTGERLPVISPDFIEQPLYKLWHLLYSVSDPTELKQNLTRQFGIEDEGVLQRLIGLDFRTAGYSNKSSKVMREIMPYLLNGFDYATACEIVDINHSDSLTKEENSKRELSQHITPLSKNSLRQPLVERVLNQMINVVNALIDQYGIIDEVRVEMARSLKSSAAERGKMSKQISKNESENKKIASLISENGIQPNKKRIQKYKMWEETGRQCMYCGKNSGLASWLNGVDSEVEHIIPRSLFFDDSFSNKTCSCRECNKKKNNMTAYDFMASQGSETLNSYIAKVSELLDKKAISKTKRDRLLTSKDEIPTDFLERDMRLTQYIARKACDVLRESIRDVWASSGIVTAYFRHQWGYDRIIHDLNIPMYSKVGMVTTEEYPYKGQVIKRDVIQDWNKRKDHRHHAIDALTIALTRHGYVQKLSNLSAYHEDIFEEVKMSGKGKDNDTLLSRWANSLPHFSTSEVSNKISVMAISTKGANKLSTPGKRKIRRGKKTMVVQRDLVIPRGALHEEYVYGRILLPDGYKKVKDVFAIPHLVCDKTIREEIKRIIDSFGGDRELASKSISKKKPFIHPVTKQEMETVKVWKEEYVIKKKIGTLQLNQIPKVVDGRIRSLLEDRAKQFVVSSDDKTNAKNTKEREKAFQASLNENPIRLNPMQAPIKSVRIATGLKPESMAGARKNGKGEEIGYVKTGSNHHVAYYRTQEGKEICMKLSFWDAILRKKAGIPLIIKDPCEAVDKMLLLSDEKMQESIAQQLPNPEWKYLIHFAKNDAFILGLSDEEIRDAFKYGNLGILSSHLYRVQQASADDINFRLHTDTSSEINSQSKQMGTSIRCTSFKGVMKLNPKRVLISITGKISLADD